MTIEKIIKCVEDSKKTNGAEDSNFMLVIALTMFVIIYQCFPSWKFAWKSEAHEPPSDYTWNHMNKNGLRFDNHRVNRVKVIRANWVKSNKNELRFYEVGSPQFASEYPFNGGVLFVRLLSVLYSVLDKCFFSPRLRIKFVHGGVIEVIPCCYYCIYVIALFTFSPNPAWVNYAIETPTCFVCKNRYAIIPYPVRPHGKR
jgi:hypothetical protein